MTLAVVVALFLLVAGAAVLFVRHAQREGQSEACYNGDHVACGGCTCPCHGGAA